MRNSDKMRLFLIYLIFETCFIKHTVTRNFTRCDLAKELTLQGFPKNQIRTWVCIIEAESSRRTDVIGGPDEDGSYDYGLFQINDRYWCSTDDEPGKGCNVTCGDLLTEDITIASVCAKKIYKQQGFPAWLGWKNECKGRSLPSVDKCS